MMKKPYKHLAVLGTLCCIAALTVLWCSVVSSDWITLQEPQVDDMELEKLGPYEEAKPHLIRTKFGLFKMCVNNSQKRYDECSILDWYNFGFIKFGPSRSTMPMPTELIANCVEKIRFTLPFIALSVVFTTASFLCLIFGHFCHKNKKIVEASLLILAGLCQATALLTFVSQIGSEFEANLPYSHHQKRLITFYKYKYGFSFYLFLLSFSLSELAALFDMAAYFRKFPPNHYVITFHRQNEPSPFMTTTGERASPRANHVNSNHNNHHEHYNSYNHYSQNTLTKHPDLCGNDYNAMIVPMEHVDVTVARVDDPNMPLPPQSYMSPEVTITTIERTTGGYGTLRNQKVPVSSAMESFGTLNKKENNL